MDSLVDRMAIQNYASKNTSLRMPIEKKYLQAYVDAMLNSSDLLELFDMLAETMHNGDTFTIFNSFDGTARILNMEPFRSIIAYAMLKKDLRLFEMISAALFTGTIAEYHGLELFSGAVKNTDEAPLKYTDSDIYTDMQEGIIQIGFKNIFSDSVLPDGTGSEYQTLQELYDALDIFDYIVTLTKPARVQVLVFYEPYCFLGGDADTVESINIDTADERFVSPFGDEDSFRVLNSMTESELLEQYKNVTYFDFNVMAKIEGLEFTRTVTKGDGFYMFSYDFRVKRQAEDPEVWKYIQIQSNDSSKAYLPTKFYRSGTKYFEKYVPVLLRLNNNDPDGPVLAFQADADKVGTIGAMLYEREYQKGE